MIRQIEGVDVASQTLVCFSDEMQWREIPNDKTGIKAYLGTLPKPTIIAIESTGGYGLLLASMAHKKGFTVYMLQPSRVKNYCKSSPSRGKSDKHDARDIASYVRAFESRLHPFVPLPSFETKLRKLSRKKEALSDHVTSIRLMLRSIGDRPAEIERCLSKLQSRIKKLQAEIDQMLSQAKDAEVLFQIPAVKANLIAAALPALRTIPFKGKYAFDSYAGIELRMSDSGKMKSRRYISHEGDAHLRRAVYLAGMAGATCKVWKPYYERLKQETKLCPVAAINALGRKILHTVYGVYKSQKPFVAPIWA
jgi:transposase